QATGERGRAGQRGDLERRAGYQGDGGELEPNASDGAAAHRALRGHVEARRGARLGMAKDPYQYFRIEARELVEGLTQGVLDLEKGAGGDDVRPRLLRLAHTLK